MLHSHSGPLTNRFELAVNALGESLVPRASRERPRPGSAVRRLRPRREGGRPLRLDGAFLPRKRGQILHIMTFYYVIYTFLGCENARS